jgi:hypothetical protein
VGASNQVVRDLAAVAVGVALAAAACGGSSTRTEKTGGAAGAPPDPPLAGAGGTETAAGGTATGGTATGGTATGGTATGGTATGGTATGGTATGGTDAADGGATANPGDVGEPCTIASDCSSDLSCTLGSCRVECRTDADCPRGSLCSGATQPYGCSLPAELECASSSDCPAPLVCAPDSKCRVGCEVSDDCPRNDHKCRTGACVGNDDPDLRWFECEDGETVCENYLTGENCYDAGFPESCYRRMGCRLDGMNWGFIDACSPGPCYYTADFDGRLSSACQ